MNLIERLANQHLFSKIFARKEAQLVANNTIWIIIDRLVRLSLGMITGIWVARYLGPELFSKFSYVNTFILFFSPITNFSIDSIVVRDISRNPENRNKILGSAFLLKSISSLVGFASALILITYLKPNNPEFLKMTFIMGSCFFFQAFDVIDLAFQSHLKSKYPAYIRTSAYVILSIVKILLITSKAPLIAFVWAFFAEIGLGALGLILVYSIKISKILEWKFDKTICGTFLKSSYILILQSFAIVIQTKLDLIIVGQYVAENELGQYSVGVRMVDMLLFFPMAIYASYAPKIAEAKIKSDEIYLSKLRNLYRLMFWLSLVIAIGMLVFGRFGITLLYGNAYSLAGILFSISGFRLMYAFLSVSKSLFYINENLMRLQLIFLVASAVTNLIISFTLIPIIGSYGAIIASVVGNLVNLIIGDLFFKPTRNHLLFFIKSIFSFK